MTAVLTVSEKDGKPHIVPYFYAFWEGGLEVVSSISEETQQRKIAHLAVALSKVEAGVSEYNDETEVDVWMAIPKYEESVHELMRSKINHLS